MPVIEFNHWRAQTAIPRVPNTTEQLLDDVVYRQAFISGDRAKETTSTTGTGPVALLGPVAGSQAFASIAVTGDLVAYAIIGTTEWEVGIGTYAANAIQRTTVLASSNAGALVSFSAGVKTVWNDFPAAHALMRARTRQTVVDVLIPRSAALHSLEYYEVPAGREVEIGIDGVLEVG